VPVYVYECEKCGERFEYTQSIKDAPKTECESCGGKLTKVIVPTAFVLKGGGWHRDLYGKPKAGDGKPEAKPQAKADAKAEAKEAKADAKPEAKPEKKPE